MINKKSCGISSRGGEVFFLGPKIKNFQGVSHNFVEFLGVKLGLSRDKVKNRKVPRVGEGDGFKKRRTPHPVSQLKSKWPQAP